MGNEDQASIIGKKFIARNESRRRLQCLADRAMRYADECRQIAYELSKAAGKPIGDHIPGMSFQARQFITGEEFETLIRDLKAERSRLADIEESISNYGLD